MSWHVVTDGVAVGAAEHTLDYLVASLGVEDRAVDEVVHSDSPYKGEEALDGPRQPEGGAALLPSVPVVRHQLAE